MGRREQRAELERTWTVLEPRVPGTPFRRTDIEDAALSAPAGESPETCPPASVDSAVGSGSAATVTLTRAEDVRHFEVGGSGTWPVKGPHGTAVITAIDKDRLTITFGDER